MLDLLTNRQREYIFGNLKNKEPKIDFIFKEQYFIEDHGEKGYFLFMIYLKIKNYYEEYVYFERKKLEFLDVIAKIGALFSTIKFIFSFIFSFYSKNFDNYKIIDKILTISNEQIELSSEIKQSISIKNKEGKNNIINDKNNLAPLINKEYKENKLNTINDSFAVDEENDDDDDS